MDQDMDRIEECINQPVDYEFTDQDIVNAFAKIGDKKKVAAICELPHTFTVCGFC